MRRKWFLRVIGILAVMPLGTLLLRSQSNGKLVFPTSATVKIAGVIDENGNPVVHKFEKYAPSELKKITEARNHLAQVEGEIRQAHGESPYQAGDSMYHSTTTEVELMEDGVLVTVRSNPSPITW